MNLLYLYIYVFIIFFSLHFPDIISESVCLVWVFRLLRLLSCLPLRPFHISLLADFSFPSPLLHCLPSPASASALPVSQPCCLASLLLLPRGSQSWTPSPRWTGALTAWRTGRLRRPLLWGTTSVSPCSPVSALHGPSILWRWFSLCWWVTRCWKFGVSGNAWWIITGWDSSSDVFMTFSYLQAWSFNMYQAIWIPRLERRVWDDG